MSFLRPGRLVEIAKAVTLRKQGLSVLEISRKMKIPKGTIGHWIANVVLTAKQKERLENLRLIGARRGCRKGSIEWKRRSDRRHEVALYEGFERAKRDSTFANICALYWGEGGKTHTSFSFTNADERMIKLVAKWLVNEGHDYICQIKLHDNICLNTAKAWWQSRLPGLSLDKIQHCWMGSGSNSCGRKIPFGTVTLFVYSTELLYSVFGGISWLANPDASKPGSIFYLNRKIERKYSSRSSLFNR